MGPNYHQSISSVIAIWSMAVHTPEYDSGYLADFLNPFELSRIAQKIATEIYQWERLNKVEADAIAFCGNSGALIGSAVARCLNKPMIMVRKTEIDSHSGMDCEGDKAADSYIIVDDCVSSGTTVKRIQTQVSAWNDAKCLGIYTRSGREGDNYILGGLRLWWEKKKVGLTEPNGNRESLPTENPEPIPFKVIEAEYAQT